MHKAKEKKVVFKVFWPFLLLVTVSCLLAIAGFITSNFIVAGFFTLVTLFVSYPIYNPNIKIVFIGTKGYARYLKKDAEDFMNNPERMKDEPGIFTYTESGFSLSTKGKTEHYEWNDIITITAYKRDNLTTDCICLTVYANCNRQFQINEELKGWSMFNKTLKEKFPQINKLWDIEIASPAFKTNMTLVYDREGRTMDEVTRNQNTSKG